MHRYWMSCPKMTVLVVCDHADIIRDTAPITRRFLGQSRWRLQVWLGRFGKVDIVKLED